MDTSLVRTALASNALFIPAEWADTIPCEATPAATAMVMSLSKLGYAVDRDLFYALCHLDNDRIDALRHAVEDINGVHLNWMPMVRNWTEPRGVPRANNIIGWLINSFPELQNVPGTRLPCGHFIPDGLFPLERYNGCPLCGRVFATADFVNTGGGEARKLLTLWTEDELQQRLRTLLESKVPLDGTLEEEVRSLLAAFGLPDDVIVPVRETAVLAFFALVDSGQPTRAAALMKTPADILRALWSKKTDSLRMVRPATEIKRRMATVGYRWEPDYEQRCLAAAAEARVALRLHYDRSMCRMVAGMLEYMPMEIADMCENMHPDRGMWVRFIRALRLSEYARKAAYPRLRELLDRFYRGDYDVWAGDVEAAVLAGDSARALSLLRERPGAFARRLFPTMLRFGAAEVIEAFRTVVAKLPVRLVVSLDSYADYCLDPDVKRSVRLAGGATMPIEPNPLLLARTPAELASMTADVKAVCRDAMRCHLAAQTDVPPTVYIAPELFRIPVPVGERSISGAGEYYMPQGTRLPVEGDKVRLFLQWGEGLPAQHLDMDLSAIIVYENSREECSYYNSEPTGAIHSEDIQHIPDMVGAAEYIELDLPRLRQAGARGVGFMASCYTDGALDVNLKAGWMDSKYPMKIDDETGVAYDPSTVQYLVHLNYTADYKSMIFGWLDVAASEVVVLEIFTDDQNAQTIPTDRILSLVEKQAGRITIGEFLALRAEATGQRRSDSPDTADEKFGVNNADIARVVAML